MNDAERKARAERAQTYRNEFLAPIIDECRQSYQARIVDIASTELDPKKREQAITALSTALRILANIDTGITAVIEDGKIADKKLLRAEEVERMNPYRRRLLDMAAW